MVTIDANWRFPIERIHIDADFIAKYGNVQIPYAKAGDHIYLVVAHINGYELVTTDGGMKKIAQHLANIRKWLGWSLTSSLEEMSAVSTAKQFTSRHIWLARKPSDAALRKIQEISLLHLGVRVCWLDDWGQGRKVFDNLLAL